MRNGSASRVCPANTTFHGPLFRGCSYSFMFRPPSLLASRVVPTAASCLAGQLRRLHPSRTCIVTFACIGYAIRPTTGNWRSEDSHRARFTALSTAPLNLGCSPHYVSGTFCYPCLWNGHPLRALEFCQCLVAIEDVRIMEIPASRRFAALHPIIRAASRIWIDFSAESLGQSGTSLPPALCLASSAFSSAPNSNAKPIQ